MHTRSLLFAMIVGVLLCLPSSALAQSIDLSVEPPQVSILIKPNTSLLQVFNFYNDGDPGVFSFTVVSFKPEGNTGGRIIDESIEGPVRFSLENADRQLNEPFSLNSNENAQAVLKIRTTPQATEGDYYYMIVLEAYPPVSQQSSGRMRARLAANILISVSANGLTPAKLSIAQFQVIPDYTLSLPGHTVYILAAGHPASVVLSIANTGLYNFSPDVRLHVEGPLGYDQKAELVPVTVLSGSQRLMTTEERTCDTCPLFSSASFRTGAWGKYRVNARIDLEGSKERLYGLTEFWVLPITLLKVIGFLFMAGSISSVLIWYTSRKTHGKRI
ncbi:MAG: hypothetical protein NUV52_01565 [Candidatus Roizmanbacteria bacterium]|nr:hypothetical protein [Candidatus Roizmanbacteria bacterium]